MSSAERQMALKRISQDTQCKIILISIKAGGTGRFSVKIVDLPALMVIGKAGLNITACNHVIIMDPWWNPYVEVRIIHLYPSEPHEGSFCARRSKPSHVLIASDSQRMCTCTEYWQGTLLKNGSLR